MSNKGTSKKSDDEDRHKGILSKTSEEQKEKRKLTTARKSIKWDEMNVTATLHPVGKDYGHVKISEVPTPYERHAQGVDAAELAKRLEEAIRKESMISETSDDYSIDADDEDSQHEETRRQMFRARRKEHYREYAAVAKLRASAVVDSDDEDGDGASEKKEKNNK